MCESRAGHRLCFSRLFVRRCKNETSWDFICYRPRIRRIGIVFNQGLNVQSRGDPAHDLVCLAMNIYNYHQKQKEREAAENALREKEEIRRMRAEARHRQSARGERRNNRDTVGVMAAVYS